MLEQRRPEEGIVARINQFDLAKIVGLTDFIWLGTIQSQKGSSDYFKHRNYLFQRRKDTCMKLTIEMQEGNMLGAMVWLAG